MKNTGFNRAISFILGLVILIQLFCAVPVSAATIACYFDYNDESYYNVVTGVVYPNLGEPIGSLPLITVTDGEPIPADQWPAEPSRIVGKHFLGWFLKGTETEIKSDTPIIEAMSGSGIIEVVAEWEEDECADITDGKNDDGEAPVLKSYDRLGNVLSPELTLLATDSGEETEFDRDVTNYKIKVLNNAEFVGIDFNICEPAATYEIKYNGVTVNEENITSVVTTSRSLDEVLNKQFEDAGYGADYEFPSGINVSMEPMTLVEGSSEMPTNKLEIVVTMEKKTTGEKTEKTYTFSIERSSEQVKLEYGNTPFGRIAGYTGASWTDEARQSRRDAFSDTYTFYNQTYKPKAWGDGGEIAGGIEPQDGEYRNYDKDETAIVAYIGSSFTDPGFTVYDADGNSVTLDAENTVKRTITYDRFISYDVNNFDDFDDSNTIESGVSDVKYLDGTTGENVIFILKDEKVRPGVYTIKYEYLKNGNTTDIFAERKLIVIPRPGDLNMDGYINSVDTAMYNRTEKPSDNTLGGRLYLYRGMDLTQDGLVDDDDAVVLRDRTDEIAVAYPDKSVAETVEPQEYISPEDTTRVQMYMDYLGKYSDSITADSLLSEPETEDEPLDAGDVFWVGYRLNNIAPDGVLGKSVHSLTAAINYDTRYVSPATVLADEGEEWLDVLKKYNPIWSGYTYNGFTNSAMDYTENNTTAKTALNSDVDIKTLVMDITAGDSPYTLQNDDYILRVPFRVNTVPPEGRAVIDASLDANTFNITTEEGGETTLEWDTRDTEDALSNNLADVIDFKGPAALEFAGEDVLNINDELKKLGYPGIYTYGDYLYINLNAFGVSGTTTENLPDWLSYEGSPMNAISGTPDEAGVFTFYIGSTKLRLEISKAQMHVKVGSPAQSEEELKTVEKWYRMYGDPNPDFGFSYYPGDLKQIDIDAGGLTSDRFINALVESPVLVCDATQYTDYDPDTARLVYFDDSKGEHKNYEFVYTYTNEEGEETPFIGELYINQQRPIAVTEVTNIPSLSSAQAYQNQNLTKGEAGTDDGLTADNVLVGDKVWISYDVIYGNTTAGEGRAVTIQSFAVVTDKEGYEKSKNYVINTEQTVLNSETGEVLAAVLTDIDVLQKPYTNYTYGDKLSYNEGWTNIILTFDSGEIKTYLHAGNVSDYDIGVVAYKNNTEMTGTTISEDLKLTVPDHDGMTIYLEPPAHINNGELITLVTISVAKKQMRVTADDKTEVYGNSIPALTYTYNTDDLAYKDDADAYAKERQALEAFFAASPPTVTTPADQGTDVREEPYPIYLSCETHPNYEFVTTDGKLTITQRPLDVTGIKDGVVPELTGKDIAAGLSRLPGSATRDQLIFDEADVYGDDDFKITYEAVYGSTVENPAYEDVIIENVEIDTEDESYPKGKNYYLSTKPEKATGVIHGRNIAAVEIVTQPQLDDYTYGDKLNLSGGAVKITYDNNQYEENITFDKLEGYGITPYVSSGNDDESDIYIKHNDPLNVPDYNGKRIKLVADTIYDDLEPVYTTDPLTVEQVTITASVESTESVYGEKPVFKYGYSGFIEGENKDSEGFKRGLKEPKIDCKATDRADVGEYTVTLSGASAANYKFEYTSGTHTITQRDLTIEAIDPNNIPPLTSKFIYENPGTQYKVPGEAIYNDTADPAIKDMTVKNLVEGDAVKITYKAIYNSSTPIPSCNVEIDKADVVLDADYGESKNYKIDSVPSPVAGGRIYDKEITKVEITAQPTRVYTYGQGLDLSGGTVDITYDSGEVVKGLTFTQLEKNADHRITFTYTKKGGAAASGDKLAVADSGESLTLTARTVYENVTAVTDPITVNPKTVNIIAKNTTSIYGGTPVFEYEYSGFAYDEDPNKGTVEGLKNPTRFISDAITRGADVGNYPVSVTEDASAANYKFEYTSGTHTITQRDLTIKSIDANVEPLTSKFIYENPGDKYEVPDEAVYDAGADPAIKDMTVENLVEGDTVKITYKAVYDSSTPTPSCTVGIAEAALDADYGESKNYTLYSVPPTAAGGRIYDKEITKVEITAQPRLDYTYGDKLDLSSLRVDITYDSGEVVKGLTFTQLAENRIALTYTGTDVTAADGDKLTVPDHDTKTITLTPTTIYDDVEAPETDPIKVEKKLLTYGTNTANPIVYDGSTTLTTGEIDLVGAEYGDTLGATGVFNFENFLAGENKLVYITDIKLDAQTELNYQLAADNSTATGTIEKAMPVAQLSEENIVLSEENIITINASEMTQVQLDGGAEYEYSIDGGQTWHKTNVFEELELRQDCSICIRFAETSNFKQSAATTPIAVKTYLNKITLISYEDMKVLTSFFTNTEVVKSSYDLDDLIGDVGAAYYGHYSDNAGKVKIVFPLTLMGDVTIYTSLDKMTSSGGGAGALYKQKGGSSEVVEEVPPVEDESVEHKPYINGYDGKVYPDDYMTRAEAVTMMINILGDTGLEYENVFPDVSSDDWYAKFVSQAVARGLILGFEDGLFYPQQYVTREQYASITARMINLEPMSGTSFRDVAPDRWSAGYIKAVSEKGIVSGYGDGTFRPENPITRAEAVRMMNAATGRVPDKKLLDELDCPFTDLLKTHWAYYEIMLAACGL